MSLSKSFSHMQILNRFALIMLESHELDELLWNIVEAIGQLLEIDDCIVYLLEGNVLVQAAAYGVKGPKERLIFEPIVIPVGEGIVGTVALTQIPEVVSDTRLDPRYITDQFVGVSEMTVPIVFQGELLGVLDSEAAGGNIYSEADLDLFQAIANIASCRIAWLLSERKRKNGETKEHIKRLKSLGNLAGGVAHDFNNLLTVISLNLELMQDCEDKEEQEESAEIMMQTLNRARGLTRQLLAFGRGGEVFREEVALDELLQESLGVLSGWARVTVETNISIPLPTVWADPDQLSRVLQNLLINAAQAMDYSGCVYVTAQTQDGSEGRQVIVSVADEGPGISNTLQAQIFEPYFTTKKSGTGLGLSTSFWIIRHHGGELMVSNREEGGACFSFGLPALHVRMAWSPSSGVISLPKLSILILAEDKLIANGLQRLLAMGGHFSKVTRRGENITSMWLEAIQNDAPFDLVILDMIQPSGIGAVKALEALRLVTPQARVVVMSGHVDSAFVTQYKEHGFDACLSKPFQHTELKRTLQTVMGIE